MNEDTVTLRVARFTKSHWKTILHSASWGIAAIVTAGVGMGRKQMNNEQLAQTVNSLTSEVHELNINMGTLSQSQAVMGAKLDNMRDDVHDLKSWRDNIREDVKQANQVHIPTLTQSHRAHKP